MNIGEKTKVNKWKELHRLISGDTRPPDDYDIIRMKHIPKRNHLFVLVLRDHHASPLHLI